jgi:hypothetical protein
MKKDKYLMTMMEVPSKQRIAITPFDLRTQRDAFSVSLEGLKGVSFIPSAVLQQSFLLTIRSRTHVDLAMQWNVNVLVAESPQAREDRKRRVRAASYV